MLKSLKHRHWAIGYFFDFQEVNRDLSINHRCLACSGLGGIDAEKALSNISNLLLIKKLAGARMRLLRPNFGGIVELTVKNIKSVR